MGHFFFFINSLPLHDRKQIHRKNTCNRNYLWILMILKSKDNYTARMNLILQTLGYGLLPLFDFCSMQWETSYYNYNFVALYSRPFTRFEIHRVRRVTSDKCKDENDGTITKRPLLVEL